jgi:hypothetical protein
MNERDAVQALVDELYWQIDQLRPRGIKNAAGNPYNPSYYRRGLEKAIDRGGPAVVEYVRTYLYKPPSGSYKKLEGADSLDLACEALVADAAKPYADLFTEEDRAAARERLAPYIEVIDKRNAERRARLDAATERLRAKGVPHRSALDAARRSHPR